MSENASDETQGLAVRKSVKKLLLCSAPKALSNDNDLVMRTSDEECEIALGGSPLL